MRLAPRKDTCFTRENSRIQNCMITCARITHACGQRLEIVCHDGKVDGIFLYCLNFKHLMQFLLLEFQTDISQNIKINLHLALKSAQLVFVKKYQKQCSLSEVYLPQHNVLFFHRNFRCVCLYFKIFSSFIYFFYVYLHIVYTWKIESV